MVAARDGARAAGRFAATAVAAAVILTAGLAPAAVPAPGALIQNTLAYPLGLAQVRTPAQSPLPGHMLAATFGGPGHLATIILLITATRFGYFAYLLGLCGWLALSGNRSVPSDAAGARLAHVGVADVRAQAPPRTRGAAGSNGSAPRLPGTRSPAAGRV